MTEKFRYHITVAYDGTDFAGFQRQPTARTVQGELERALAEMVKEQVTVFGAGRTDSGVHALRQSLHVDLPFKIDADGIKAGLNTLLPKDIVVQSAARVPQNFHARYDAKERTYRYRVFYGKPRNPFKERYTLWHPYGLEVERLEKGLSYFQGEHDFTSFASIKTPIENKVRTLYEASVVKDAAEEEYIFTFCGSGFLYNMVRIIVGTLLEVGDGRREVDEIEEILKRRDRSFAGPTIGPSGLFLVDIAYDKNNQSFEEML